MKVLITTDCYSPTVNGVVTSILNLESELRTLGHKVKILCPSQNIHCFDNGDVYQIGSLGAGKIYSGARAAFRISTKNCENIIAWKPDIIHSQSEFTSFIMAKKIAEAVDCPIVHTYHTVYEDYTHYFSPSIKLGRKAVISFTKHILSQVQTVITPSKKIEKLLKEYGTVQKTVIIPTGLDVERFMQKVSEEQINILKQELCIPQQNKILITIGRAAREKNIEELMQYFKLMNLPDSNLVIVGGGPYLSELKIIAKEMGITDKVIFTGMVDPSNIQKYYQLGDIFLSASTSETQGLTYIEAFASGLPAVCRRDECLSDVIKNGINGFQYDDYDGFSDAVLNILNNEPLKAEISQNAKNTALDYSKTIFAQRVEQIYRETLKNYEQIADRKITTNSLK